MGASHDDFTKYPRTPHLFGSRGTDDDKHLGQQESLDFIADYLAHRGREAEWHERRQSLDRIECGRGG